MASSAEQGLTTGLEELRRISAKNDELVKNCRAWEVAYKTLEAEHNQLKQFYADLKLDSDRYKGYSVELRTRLQDIGSVIIRAMQDARGKGLMDNQLKADTVTGGKDPIPQFLKQGPVDVESKFLLETVPHPKEQ